MGKRGRPPYPDILTPREWEVLELLRLELSNPEIAERLGISRDGAKYHVSQILGKLGLENRDQAARWQYADARPWWAVAIAPLFPAWRRAAAMAGGASGNAAKAALFIVVLAAIGGLGLLAVLLFLQSGDGDEVATVGETPAANSDQLSYMDEEGALWLVSADGSDRTLLDAGAECKDLGDLEWSPPGHRLACVLGFARVVLINASGELVSDDFYTGRALSASLHWAPDGEHFVLAHPESFQDGTFLKIVDDDGQLVASLGPADLTASGYSTASYGFPLWSPDGQQLVYRTLGGELRIYSLSERTEETIFGDFWPMGWVEDGSALLAATNYQAPATLDGFPSYEVGVLELGSVGFSSVKSLNNGVQFWLAPDGSQAVMIDRREDGIGLALVDVPGGAPIPIPESSIGYPSDSLRPSQVTFSPDGGQVYWVDATWPAVVYRANADGTNLKKLAEAPALIGFLSPDLSSLVYTVIDDTATLYVADIDSGRVIELDAQPSGGGQIFPSAWRPVPR